MTLTRRVLNLGYSVSRITGGLFLHPYQTMQSLIEDRQLVWLSVIPSVILALVTMTWRWLVVPMVQVFSSCSAVAPWMCQVIGWASDWLVCVMLVWQIVLLYLLFRFKWVWQKWHGDN